MPKLVILSDDGSRREVELTTRDLSIGRATENDLALPDPAKGVSRMHAEIRYENGRYVILDLNSQNGTFLNGDRVQRADLASGSEISIGPYRLTFQSAGAEALAPPVQLQEASTPGTTVSAPAQPISAPPTSPAPVSPASISPGAVPAVGIPESSPAAVPPMAGPPAAVPPPPVQKAPRAMRSEARVDAAASSSPLRSAARPSSAPASPTPNAPKIPARAAPPLAAEPDLVETSAGVPKSRLVAGLAAIVLVGLALGWWYWPTAPNRTAAADPIVKPQEGVPPPKPEAPATDLGASPAPPTVSDPAIVPPVEPPTAAVAKPEPVPPPVAAPPLSAAPPAGGTPSARGASSDGSRGGVRGGPENLASPRRASETPQAWRARNADLQTQYNAAKSSFERGQFAAAISGFDALLKAEPRYLDAAQLRTRAREEAKSGGRDAIEAGNKLDAASNWVQALEQFDRARQLDPSLASRADEGAKRVRDKMRVAGADAFKRARQYDALGRTADALREYQNAAQWLPADDANRVVALQRTDQLKAGAK